MQSKVKTFRELVEAMNKKRPKYDPSPDDENTNFFAKQTVAGEQKFRDVHVVKIQDEPEENGPANATTPKSNKQGASLGRSGEDIRPKQGSSKLPTRYKSIAAFTAQTPARRGDADQFRPARRLYDARHRAADPGFHDPDVRDRNQRARA